MARRQRHVHHRCHGTEETVEGAKASRARIAITGSNSDESLGPRQPRKSHLLKKRKSKSYRVKTKTKRHRHGSRRRLRDTGSSSSSASVTGESDNREAKSDDLFGSSDASGSAETNASTICDAGKDGGDVTAQDDLVSVPKLDVMTFDDWEELESYIKVYGRRTFQIYSVRTATPINACVRKSNDWEYIGENTTVQPAMKDVHNLVACLKRETYAFPTIEERIASILGILPVVKAIFSRVYASEKNFPEVLLIDATDDTNVSNYKLFIFMIQDVVGKGQHVQSTACHYHVVLEAMKVLLTSEVKNTLWFEYFDANWTNCKQRWSSVYRGNVPHMGKHTNNRRMRRFHPVLAEVNERAWARTINRVGVYVNVEYDDELNTLSNLVSRHAVELAKQHYDFALPPTTKYNLLTWALQCLAEANDDSTEEHPPSDVTRVKAQTEKFKELQAVGKPIAEIGCQWGTKTNAALTSTLVEFVRVVKTGSCPVLSEASTRDNPETEPRNDTVSPPQTVCETPAVPDTIADTEENNEEWKISTSVKKSGRPKITRLLVRRWIAKQCGSGIAEGLTYTKYAVGLRAVSVLRTKRPKITMCEKTCKKPTALDKVMTVLPTRTLDAVATQIVIYRNRWFNDHETQMPENDVTYDVGGWEPREAFWTEDLLDREAVTTRLKDVNVLSDDVWITSLCGRKWLEVCSSWITVRCLINLGTGDGKIYDPQETSDRYAKLQTYLKQNWFHCSRHYRLRSATSSSNTHDASTGQLQLRSLHFTVSGSVSTRNVPIGVIGNVNEAMQFFRFRYLCHNLLAIHSPEIEGDSCLE
ncbi:hypothetical protein GQ600_7431 [Phytophthora cactorum]|nr:hypothetical protein GQ600_7431 [Phytophthora cactorum]